MGNANSGKPLGKPILKIGDNIKDDKRDITIIDIFYIKNLEK